MSSKIIQEKLIHYNCKTIVEQESAFKEIVQEITLMSLAKSGFFHVAAFQGGTCLRIFYHLERFSEDLDFVLEKPDKSFKWNSYLKDLKKEFLFYGFDLEIKEKNKLENSIKTVFLKTDSIGGILIIQDNRTNKPQLHIKLEIDSNPPEGSGFELKYLDFPLPYGIKCQNIESLFAGKCHALVCRPYPKGRDWFDFIWYTSKKTCIHFQLLENAINQFGPWMGQKIRVDLEWLKNELKSKINTLDIDVLKKDVSRFLRAKDLILLETWSKDFFVSWIDKLGYQK